MTAVILIWAYSTMPHTTIGFNGICVMIVTVGAALDMGKS
jgi:hypothetical protein